MKKIIDVRFRPPIGSYLEMTMFREKDRTARMAKPTGTELAPSMLKESMELFIEEMDSVGKYIGCVSGLKRGVRAMGWIENKEIHDIVKKYPDHMIGIGGLDLSDRRKALDDIDCCINEYGFKAVIIEPGSGSHKVPLFSDDRRLYPIYSKCADMGVPIFILAGGLTGPDPDYADPVHLDHVAADIPELKIVALHGGWPWVTKILYVAFRRPNVYISADNYIAFPGSEEYIKAINTYLYDRFLYGTGYPFHPIVGYLENFKSLGIKEEYMDNVLYKNAEKLLKLN